MKTLAIQHKNTFYVKTIDNKLVLQITPNSHRIIWYKQIDTFIFENPIEIEVTNQKTIEVIKNSEVLLKEIKEKEALERIATQKRIEEEKEIRKTNLINLWNFRKGKTDVFRVRTGFRFNNDKIWDDEILSVEYIFGKIEAKQRFDELKGSENPKENEQYFFVELQSLYEGSKRFNRLEITSLDELNDCDFDSIECDEYAPSIEDKQFIVTKTQSHWSKPIQYNIEQRRVWNGYIGSVYYSEQKTTADLCNSQIAYTEEDIYDSDDNILIAEFIDSGLANKDVAKECMSEMDFEIFFGETENIE